MKDFEIRKATLSDLERLQQIGRQTFYETFAAVNSEVNMLKYLEESFSLQKLTDELYDPQATFYLAMYDQEVIGYLKLNLGSSQTALQDPEALEIERIYVCSIYQGKKVG
jgi:N-acetylglutamate synthase-like GNAT family acetyltransferase